MKRGVRNFWVWLLISFQILGCAHTPAQTPADPSARQVQIARGISVPPLDLLASLLAFPMKLILWNLKMGNHNISSKTEDDIRRYLTDNQLYDVKIRLNQFAPWDEAVRVVKNHKVGIPYRIIFMPFSIIYASLGRLVGGLLFSDYYDPISDTVHVFSDHTAVALHEAGHAKDFANRKYRGTYALGRMIGLTSYMQEEAASEDALDYLIAKDRKEEAIAACKVLYPAYSSYLGAPFGLIGYFFGIGYGHYYGRVKARQLKMRFKLDEELQTFRKTGERPKTPVVSEPL